MRSLHEAAGAVWGTLRGVEVPRRYGDPAGEYTAAGQGVAVRDRSHRLRLRFGGRQPAAMLTGVVTGRIPGAWADLEPGVMGGRVEPEAVLTPKGRMVADLRLWREEGDGGGFLADVPRAAAAPLLEHLGRYLPPRLVSTEDVSGQTGMLTVMGPEAPGLLSREALGLRVEAEALAGLAEDEARMVGGVLVIRCGEVSVPSWDVVADRASIRALWRRLLALGAAPVGSGVWEALRLEAGRPAFGADMDTETLMPETGLGTRAVDHAKGCYTGQEVVVRIRDRGHVNRYLRRLRLGEGPTPAPGSELWTEGGERPVGHLTSVAVSPRLGTLALGYVRREVEPGSEVAVDSPGGARGVVEAL
jgi:tRNA-modifying protein YgfZ